MRSLLPNSPLKTVVWSIQFKPYKRDFHSPIIFAQGLWQHRIGWLLKIEDQEGRVGYGDIAPLPQQWGGESIEDLTSHIRNFPSQSSLSFEAIGHWVNAPALQSALSMAFLMANGYGENGLSSEVDVAWFLPQGLGAIDSFKKAYQKGYRTFKLKIGIDGFAIERDWLGELLHDWPSDAKFRLDANQSLSLKEAEKWIAYLEGKPIEFLEEPLDDFHIMQALAKTSPIPLALDEQVGTFSQLERVYELGWKGICVIKPSAIGDWEAFREMRSKMHLDLVYATAFETAIGASAVLQLAGEMPIKRAVGLGALSAMVEDGLGLQPLPAFKKGWQLMKDDYQKIWSRL